MFTTRNQKHNFQTACCELTIDTHPEDGLHEAARIRIGAKSRTMDYIQHQMDDVSGFAKKMYPEEFWQLDTYVQVKG